VDTALRAEVDFVTHAPVNTGLNQAAAVRQFEEQCTILVPA
jgi:hypothetical protein